MHVFIKEKVLRQTDAKESSGQEKSGREKGQKEISKPGSIVAVTPSVLERASVLLHKGGLVAFPTETVYGLGGDATNDQAVAAIFAAKGRPEFDPLIVHVSSPVDAASLVEWCEVAQTLALRFWPGPLTFVLPRKSGCPASLLASSGLETLAVRMPAHRIALDLLKVSGLPIAAPSANAFGKLSPTTPQHVADSLGTNVDLILDGGPTVIGVESTVLDLTGQHPLILRPGGITREQLEDTLGEKIGNALHTGTPLSPGMLKSHYAPDLPLRLNALEAGNSEALLAFGPDSHVPGGALRLNLSVSGDLKEASANLFSMLRQLDRTDFSRIAVMPIPESGLGAAINDRLRRAAAHT